jgi:hypothetical protein
LRGKSRRSGLPRRQLLAGKKPPPGPSELPADHNKYSAIDVPARLVAKRYRKQPEAKPSSIALLLIGATAHFGALEDWPYHSYAAPSSRSRWRSRPSSRTQVRMTITVRWTDGTTDCAAGIRNPQRSGFRQTSVRQHRLKAAKPVRQTAMTPGIPQRLQSLTDRMRLTRWRRGERQLHIGCVAFQLLIGGWQSDFQSKFQSKCSKVSCRCRKIVSPEFMAERGSPH